MMSPTTSTRVLEIASEGNILIVSSFQFFKASGLVRFPRIAPRALPVIAARLKAAAAARVAIKALRVAIDQPSQ